MSSSENEDEEILLTPPVILEAAQNVRLETLPLRSQKSYWNVYEVFDKWRLDKKLKISFNTMLAYFGEIAEKYKPSTLWSKYSMLRTTIHNKHGIKIEEYKDLVNFLRSKSKGYVPKKSKVLSAENDLGEVFKITLNDTKNKSSRQFIIEGEHSQFVRKYLLVRPSNGTVNRFFLTYRDGKCINKPIGKNKIGKMPSEIAQFLRLPESELYTGHAFRRSSATICAEQGIYEQLLYTINI